MYLYTYIRMYFYVDICMYVCIHTYEGAENMADAHLVYLAQPLTKHCERALNDSGIQNN